MKTILLNPIVITINIVIHAMYVRFLCLWDECVSVFFFFLKKKKNKSAPNLIQIKSQNEVGIIDIH